MQESTDRWHRWLLQTRFGGDAEARQRELANRLHPVRDKVLGTAGLQPQDTLLDIGVGDGLIGIDRYATLSPANVLWILNHHQHEQSGRAGLTVTYVRGNNVYRSEIKKREPGSDKIPSF